MSYHRPAPSTHSERSQSSSSHSPTHRPSNPPQPAEPQDLKSLFQALDNLLVLKLSDGIPHTQYGKPNLNADINRTMRTIKSHPRFPELQHEGEFNEKFLDIWAELEELARGWKDDDTRDKRLEQHEGVHDVQKRLWETVLEGKSVFASGEVEEFYW